MTQVVKLSTKLCLHSDIKPLVSLAEQYAKALYFHTTSCILYLV